MTILPFLFSKKNANTVFAGPTSGGAGVPGFRALVSGDIPGGGGGGGTLYTPTLITTAHTIANSGEQFCVITVDDDFDITLPAVANVADGYTIYISDLFAISNTQNGTRHLLAQGTSHIYAFAQDWSQSIAIQGNILMSGAFFKQGTNWYALMIQNSAL